MKKMYLLAGMCCILLPPCRIYAQPMPVAANDSATEKSIALFYNGINDNARLYNGFEYIMYDQRIKGYPYFLAPDMNSGDILYDGILYKNIPLLHELTTGNVVVRAFNHGVLMNLIKEKVSYFTLLNHYFVHLVPDSTNKVITNGFYDRIYNGTTVLYAYRQKSVYEDPNNFDRSFVENNHYFIYKNNTYYPVSDRGSVLSVFKDRKKELTKYLRQNNIKFRKTPEYAMAKMAEYYDTLTH